MGVCSGAIHLQKMSKTLMVKLGTNAPSVRGGIDVQSILSLSE